MSGAVFYKDPNESEKKTFAEYMRSIRASEVELLLVVGAGYEVPPPENDFVSREIDNIERGESKNINFSVFLKSVIKEN